MPEKVLKKKGLKKKVVKEAIEEVPQDGHAEAPSKKRKAEKEIMVPNQSNPDSTDADKPDKKKMKKAKQGADVGFIQKKREEKAEKAKSLPKEFTSDDPRAKYVNVRVETKVQALIGAVIKKNFPGSATFDMAPRMTCAWMTFDKEKDASKFVKRGDLTIYDTPVKVRQGKNGPTDVFCSFVGPRLVGGIISKHLGPGCRDMIDDTANAVKARYEGKSAAQAAMAKGKVTVEGVELEAVGPWALEEGEVSFVDKVKFFKKDKKRD